MYFIFLQYALKWSLDIVLPLQKERRDYLDAT